MRCPTAACSSVTARRDDPSRSVEILLSDNGQGIDEDTQQHVFEPFFSTKPAGSGSGLGLAVTHTLVTAAKGDIFLDSAPGRGTTLHIRLPWPTPLALEQVAFAVDGDQWQRIPAGTRDLLPQSIDERIQSMGVEVVGVGRHRRDQLLAGDQLPTAEVSRMSTRRSVPVKAALRPDGETRHQPSASRRQRLPVSALLIPAASTRLATLCSVAASSAISTGLDR